jgi:hypothetical protein
LVSGVETTITMSATGVEAEEANMFKTLFWCLPGILALGLLIFALIYLEKYS